ncbi:cystatin-C-like [Anableps anableps]
MSDEWDVSVNEHTIFDLKEKAESFRDSLLLQSFCSFSSDTKMWKAIFPFLAALFVGLSCIPGGINKIEDADNDEEFQRALKFAVVQHNNGTNDTVLHQVLKVVSAAHQVVEGSKHIMTVLLGRTNCEKEAPAENCGVYKEPAHAQPYQCEFEVWSRPWLNDTQLIKEECGCIEHTTE